MEEDNRLRQERIKKLGELREKGIEPYPYSFSVRAYSKEIKERFKDLLPEEKASDEVNIAGRIMTIRRMGKASFFHLEDGEGRIQVYIRQDDIGEKIYEIFRHADIGDIVGIIGTVFSTKTGEITVYSSSFHILSKSLLPLPDKWHGIKDVEVRYRKRYVDLIMNKDIRDVFALRSRIIQEIRNYYLSKGFLEVEIPILQTIYGGASAKPFVTHHNALNMKMYLSISPEMYLKRLIVGGFPKVFTFGKCFRNEGIDRTHNPEFTNLESYEAYIDYEQVMKHTEELFSTVVEKVHGSPKVKFQDETIDFSPPFKRISMIDALKEYAKIDATTLSDEELFDLNTTYTLAIEGELNRGIVIERLFEELVEARLIQPTFVIDHPKESTPLCKGKRGDPSLIERFELYINGWEIANAYSELNDPLLQKQLLKEQAEKGRGGDEEAHPYDADFIEALEYGMPPTGGLGIGIDRVVMLLTNSASIRDVLFFPVMKPEEQPGQ